MAYLIGMLLAMLFFAFIIVYALIKPRYFNKHYQEMPKSIFWIYTIIIAFLLAALSAANL